MEKNSRQALIYFVTVLGLSWLVFWGPLAVFKIETINLIGGSKGPLWAIMLFIIGGFVPSVVGIILTRIYDGKQGLKQLFKSAFKIKIGLKWFFMIIGVTLFYAVSLIIIYSLTGHSFDYSQFLNQLPTIIPLIILGPLSEEFGWRGFAIKKMLKVASAINTTFLIGIIWALWHLPLFHMIGTSQHEFGIPFIAFFISVLGSSFVYTYLYIKTGNIIFSAILLHWLYTYVLQVISTTVIRTTLYNWLEIIPGLIVGIVFGILLITRGSKPSSVDV